MPRSLEFNNAIIGHYLTIVHNPEREKAGGGEYHSFILCFENKMTD